MNTPLIPLGDRVVAVGEAVAEKTSSGLYLPKAAKEKPPIATVCAIGPDVKGLEEGDKVIYREYSTVELTIDGTEYLIIKENDVLTKLA